MPDSENKDLNSSRQKFVFMFWENKWKDIYVPGLSMVNKVVSLAPLGQGFSACMPLYFAECGRLNSLLR